MRRNRYWSGLSAALVLLLLSCGSPPRPATPPATAVGLNAQFFAGSGFSGPALERLEPRLALAGAVPGLWPGPFSARYQGFLLAPRSGAYTLHLGGQGQARLFLDGRLVAQELPVSVRLNLHEGQRLGLRVEYQSPPSQAQLRLDWEGPGLPREAVPPSALRPAQEPPRPARADLTPQAVSRGWELLWNPDFEQGSVAWVELAGGQLAPVAGRQGGQALQAQNWTYAAQTLPWMYVQVGPTYTLEGWARSPQGVACVIGLKGGDASAITFDYTLSFSGPDWQQQSRSFTLPAGTLWAEAYVQAQAGPNQSCEFDDLSLFAGSKAPLPPAPELLDNRLQNPGFEQGLAGWTLATGSAQPGAGGRSGAALANQAWSWVYQIVPLRGLPAWQRLVLKGWVQNPENQACTLGLQGGSETALTFDQPVHYRALDWREVYTEVSLPPGTTWLGAYLAGPAGCRFDDLQLGVPAGSASPLPTGISLDSRTAFAGSGFNLAAEGGEEGVSYTWNLGDGTTATGETVYHEYAQPGYYTVTLTATAPDGQTTTLQQQVAQLPSIHAMPEFRALADPLPLAFDVQFPLPGHTYEWRFSDGTVLSGPRVERPFPNLGFYDVTLVIYEEASPGGLSRQSTGRRVVALEQTRINRIAEVPIADIEGVQTGPTSFIFSAAASEGEGPLTYTWDFGDGTRATGAEVSETYSGNGRYPIVLTVTDRFGQTDQEEAVVTLGTQYAPGSPATHVTAGYSGPAQGQAAFTGQTASNPFAAAQASRLGLRPRPDRLRAQALSPQNELSRRVERSRIRYLNPGTLQRPGLRAQAADLELSNPFPFVLYSGVGSLQALHDTSAIGSPFRLGSASVLVRGLPQPQGLAWDYEGIDPQTNTAARIRVFRAAFPSPLASGLTTLRTQAQLQSGLSVGLQSDLAAFAGLRVPRVTLSVLPDTQFPSGPSLQEYVAEFNGQRELMAQVNIRLSQVSQNGFVFFELPVYAVDEAGRLLDSVSGVFHARFADPRILSVSNEMVRGRATMLVALNLANFADGATQFDLRPITLFSGNPANPCGSNNQYAAFGATLSGCTQISASYEAPAGLSLEAYPYTLPPEYPSRTNRVLIGKNLNEVGFYDQNLRDAIEPSLGLNGQGLQSQSQAGEIARLILGFIPIVGDAVDGLEQLYNAATGRQVDPVLAVLSAAGLALDLGSGGLADVSAGVKAAYRISLAFARQGGGLVAEVIRAQFVQFAAGRLSPRALVNSLQQRFATIIELSKARGCGGFINNTCLVRYDRIATLVRARLGLQPTAALARVDETLAVARGKTPNVRLQLAYTNVVLTCARQAAGQSVTGQSVFCDGINIAHIFEGEINKSGRAVGFHYYGDGTFARGKARIDQITTPPDARGFYEAKVSVYDATRGLWIPKKIISSMWPDSWTPQEVVDDILSAFQNATFTERRPNEWTGTSARGTRVRGYLLAGTKDIINTAYPLLREEP
jgi:PKD repeat protein